MDISTNPANKSLNLKYRILCNKGFIKVLKFYKKKESKQI
jgi:hypothetical protein